MTLKDKLLSLLKLAHQEEQTLYASLDENERSEIGTLEQWSAKDTLEHIIYWKEYMVRNIAATLRNEKPGKRGDENKINAEVFEANKNNSWDDTVAHLERAYESSIKCVRSIPDEMLVDPNTLPWQEDRQLWIIIDGNGYEHPIIHLADYYFRRGDSKYAVKLYEQAANLTKELSDDPDWLGGLKYNLACCYALSGQPKRAIDELGEALKLNTGLIEWSKEDPDFTSIRGYDEYKSLYKP